MKRIWARDTVPSKRPYPQADRGLQPSASGCESESGLQGLSAATARTSAEEVSGLRQGLVEGLCVVGGRLAPNARLHDVTLCVPSLALLGLGPVWAEHAAPALGGSPGKVLP